MPQKLNKAGQMQDYIPKGNGDASGEYGTSQGTNKNFTASDKKKTQANVIDNNKDITIKSVVDKPLKEQVKERTEADSRRDTKYDDLLDRQMWAKTDEEKRALQKEMDELRNKSLAKANIIDNDLTGKGNSIQEAYNLLNSDNIESIEYEMNWKNTSSDRDNLTFNKKLDDKNKFLNMLDATYGSKKQLEHNLAFSHQTNYLILKVKEKGHRAKEVKLSYEDLIKLNNKITGKRTKQ